MELYKKEYNDTLKRYCDGCTYLKEHPETIEKYLPEINKIINKLNNIIEEYNIKDSNIILNGFKEEN